MVKGPGLYADVGKKARDMLYKDYQTDQKFILTTTSPTGKEGELLVADINTQLIKRNVTTDVLVNTGSNIATTLTFKKSPSGMKELRAITTFKLLRTVTADESAAPGVKAILSFDVSYPEIKQELQYLHDYVGMSSSFGLTTTPLVNVSAVFGSNGIALGADVAFDSKSGNFTKYNAGLSYSNADLIASFALNESGDSVNASYYHVVNPLTATAVGAEVSRSLSTNETMITIGTQHSLDPLSSVKARVNSHGKVNALIQHEWRPKSLSTVFSELDIMSMNKSPKVGLALALKP